MTSSKPVANGDVLEIFESPERTLRARILDVATELFAAKGYAGTSVREVAEAAGCTKPALYYHFANKEGLFRAAVTSAHATFERVEALARDAGTVRERLLRSFEAVAEIVERHPSHMRLLFRAENHAQLGQPLVDMEPLRAKHFGLVRALVEAGVATGEIRPDVDIEDATLALVGMVHFQLQAFLEGRPFQRDFGERLVRLFMEGVRG